MCASPCLLAPPGPNKIIKFRLANVLQTPTDQLALTAEAESVGRHIRSISRKLTNSPPDGLTIQGRAGVQTP